MSGTLALKKAERALIREYRSRQRRYAVSVHGLMRGRNAHNDRHMAEQIAALEAAVEELGGNTGDCLRAARKGEAL